MERFRRNFHYIDVEEREGTVRSSAESLPVCYENGKKGMQVISAGRLGLGHSLACQGSRPMKGAVHTYQWTVNPINAEPFYEPAGKIQTQNGVAAQFK